MAGDRTLAKTDMDSSVAWGFRKDSGMEGVLGGHGDARRVVLLGACSQQAGGGTESTILMLPFFSTTLVDSDRRHIALQPDRAISLAWLPSPLVLPRRGLTQPRGLTPCFPMRATKAAPRDR